MSNALLAGQVLHAGNRGWAGTTTQKQVFRLAALGKSDREMAEQLLISPSAVRSILEHRIRPALGRFQPTRGGFCLGERAIARTGSTARRIGYSGRCSSGCCGRPEGGSSLLVEDRHHRRYLSADISNIMISSRTIHSNEFTEPAIGIPR